jgi:hypothetical protein
MDTVPVKLNFTTDPKFEKKNFLSTTEFFDEIYENVILTVFILYK